VLTGIHVYLGLHVLARGVVFVDLALAQVAGLGISMAFLAGHAMQSRAAYWYALAFTLTGALVFSASRLRRAPVPQEAIIGIVYAVSAAAAVLVVDRAPQGSEHVKQLLVGNILTVSPADVATLAVVYGVIGAGHWLIRRPLLEISLDPEGARSRGRRLWLWDFVFYASFGFVVTSSVRIAGVLLVFSYLIVPATLGALVSGSVPTRLAVGWALGALVSGFGLVSAYVWDLPTGAAIVTTFGVALAVAALALGAIGLRGRWRAHGPRALAPLGVALGGVIGLAGLLLLAFPFMDHHWLDWLEAAVPSVERAFLTSDEVEARADSTEAVERGVAEVERLRVMQQEIDWGTRQVTAEMRERLRQYLAGRREMIAGDRVVLKSLRDRARHRQRYWLGIPLTVIGAAGVVVSLRVIQGRRP
jgi:zinc/manganese transport system permease protein